MATITFPRMTTPTRFSLSELEQESGVSARQIRELIRLGVLPAPSSGGRGATYGQDHLDRLRVWQKLRAEAPPGTKNEQLRAVVDRLHAMGVLRAVAEGKVPFALVDDLRDDVSVQRLADFDEALAASVVQDSPRAPTSVNEEALDYLRAMRSPLPAPARLSVAAHDATPRLEVDLRAAKETGAAPALASLREALQAYVATHAAPVRVNPPRTDTWQRVTIGRDLEIAARGSLTPEVVQLLETVGQLLQQAIYRKEP